MKVLQKKVEEDQVSGTPTPINIQVSLSLFNEIKLYILCNIIAALVSLPSDSYLFYYSFFNTNSNIFFILLSTFL